ncbi:zinc ribbon domain-containing protein [Candidatus Gracilibacteria bacterium]|nr:zinc ribbon domain-containing protein [Candidatus Gracilibacteria bacterium]
MPIYEYHCPACQGRFQKLVQGFTDPPGLACPRCGNVGVKRAVSRFATVKSEEARAEALADPANFAGLDESDPRSIARWARQMGKELGDDAGEDWDEMVDEMLEEELSGGADEGDAPPKKSDNLGWGD